MTELEKYKEALDVALEGLGRVGSSWSVWEEMKKAKKCKEKAMAIVGLKDPMQELLERMKEKYK